MLSNNSLPQEYGIDLQSNRNIHSSKDFNQLSSNTLESLARQPNNQNISGKNVNQIFKRKKRVKGERYTAKVFKQTLNFEHDDINSQASGANNVPISNRAGEIQPKFPAKKQRELRSYSIVEKDCNNLNSYQPDDNIIHPSEKSNKLEEKVSSYKNPILLEHLETKKKAEKLKNKIKD